MDKEGETEFNESIDKAKDEQKDSSEEDNGTWNNNSQWSNNNYNYNSYYNYNNYYYGNCYSNYNYETRSKETTGFVGLENQGATCYMNSMLQSLYHIPAFRRLVYAFPTTGTEDLKTSIPLNLQHLFVRMQLSSKAVSTKALTRSFGWDDSESFVQHDTHEFCRVLLDNIETKLKGTQLESAIADLFRGHFRSYVRCTNVDYKSERVEEFYDIQLTVKDISNLEDSFKAYIATEKLEGDNLYDAGEFGKQEALIGSEFIDFPKVLQIHLRRFDFDYNTLQQVKINSKFEFPTTLDVSPYLAKDAVPQSHSYELFGVLVHHGSVYGGHYYAFLRPSTDPQWFEFNDSTVTRVSEKKAVNDNFGGTSETKSGYSSYYSYDKTYSAYILVYVRKDVETDVFHAVEDDSIPKHLINYYNKLEEEEKAEAEQRIHEANQIKIVLNGLSTLEKNAANCVSGFTDDNKETKISVDRNEKMIDVTKKVLEKLELDAEHPEKYDIWHCTYDGFPSTCINSLAESSMNMLGYSIHFFVDQKAIQVEDDPVERPITVWTKFFCPNTKIPIKPIAPFSVFPSHHIDYMFPAVCKQIGLPEDSQLLVFEETRNQPRLISSDLSFKHAILNTGSVLIFQLSPQVDQIIPPNLHYEIQQNEPKAEKAPEEPKSEKAPEEPKSEKAPEEPKAEKAPEETTPAKKEELPVYYWSDLKKKEANTVDQYILTHGQQISIKVGKKEDKKPLFILQFPDSITFSDLKEIICEISGETYDQNKNSLEFFKNESLYPVSTSYSTPGFLFSPTYEGMQTILYEFHRDISELQLNSTQEITVVILKDGLNADKEMSFRIDKGATYSTLVNEIRKIDPEAPEKMTIVETWSNKVYRVINVYDRLYNTVSPFLIVYSDISNCKPVAWGKFNNNNGISCFGNPFYFEIIEGEKFEDFVKRLKESVKIENPDDVQIVVADNYPNYNAKIEKMEPDTVVSNVLDDSHFLYIVSGKEQPKPVTTSYGYSYSSFHQKEQAIKIKN